MKIDMAHQSNHWQPRLTAFAAQLTQREGYHSVKDLCEFLLREHWVDSHQVVQYLHDYLAVSRKHLAFHTKWAALSNMKNLASYDQLEIEKVQELLEVLAA